MITNKTEETKNLAIAYTRSGVLPPELSEETDVWVYAIVRVLKANTKEEYVVARHEFRNGEDTFDVIKDFGECFKIVKAISIHPYEVVEYVPEFKDSEERIKYLCKVYKCKKEEFKDFTEDRLCAAVKKYLIFKHINKDI